MTASTTTSKNEMRAEANAKKYGFEYKKKNATKSPNTPPMPTTPSNSATTSPSVTPTPSSLTAPLVAETETPTSQPIELEVIQLKPRHSKTKKKHTAEATQSITNDEMYSAASEDSVISEVPEINDVKREALPTIVKPTTYPAARIAAIIAVIAILVAIAISATIFFAPAVAAAFGLAASPFFFQLAASITLALHVSAGVGIALASVVLAAAVSGLAVTLGLFAKLVADVIISKLTASDAANTPPSIGGSIATQMAPVLGGNIAQPQNNQQMENTADHSKMANPVNNNTANQPVLETEMTHATAMSSKI